VEKIDRRSSLSGLGIAAGASAFSRNALGLLQQPANATKPNSARVQSPFRVAVINDEITQDFGRACEITAREFRLGWIELRGMWDKNVLNLDEKELQEARRAFCNGTSCGLPTSPAHCSRLIGRKRSIELAKFFAKERIRGFDFWRLDNQKPFRQSNNPSESDPSKKSRNAAEAQSSHCLPPKLRAQVTSDTHWDSLDTLHAAAEERRPLM
jgi:hypothetical protein